MSFHHQSEMHSGTTKGDEMRTTLRLTLAALASAAMVSAAAAQSDEESQEELSERVDALERKLDLILERLGEDDVELEEGEAESLREARDMVRDALTMDEEEERGAQDRAGMQPEADMTAQETAAEPALRPDAAMRAAEPEPRTVQAEDGFRVGNTQVSYDGFIKLDTIVSNYSDGNPSTDDLGRDFYIPSLIPVSDGGQEGDTLFDFNPRETRFIFKTRTQTGGLDIKGHLEFDFQVTGGANERVSNSFTPRMRQAFITINDQWLFGQAWSTFQDVRALPEALDFIGPTESTIFNRQPMIRYTYNNGPNRLELAAETPETTLTPFGGGGRIISDNDIAPDVVARYSYNAEWGHVSLAGLGRALRADDEQTGLAEDETTYAGGVSLTGKITLGGFDVPAFARDDIRFAVNAGSGLGRYLGVNLINGAVIDEEGQLEALRSASAYIAYRHFWSEKWRSNIMGGYFMSDVDTDLTGEAITRSTYSVHANVLYSPVPNFSVGLEYIFAERELENDLSGNLNRVQFSAKYAL
jgi:hypothetical protein